MGDRYYLGDDVAEDSKEAVKWYSKAAEQGIPAAQFNLGFCYENGTGVRQDYKEAVKWYRLAATIGNEDAKDALKRMGK